MTEAVGYSHLSPAVPILSFLAMVSMLLLIPSFWKTRIVALVALVGWLFVVNLINFTGMIHWRGHTNDAPVLASICESFVSSSYFSLAEIPQ
jgi:prepilin signal peptidase PulO-like enzyme (type II secretory pathway)